MSRKSKGTNAERDIVHMFWATEGWSAVRIAGSGSMRYPSADVLATNRVRRLAIECKSTKDDKKYFSKEEIKQLMDFSSAFGAEPWFALKFKGSSWLFFTPEELKEKENSFFVDVFLASERGVLFEELIKP